MGEKIANTEIKREKGYLYYTKTDEKGCLEIWRAKMHGKKKKAT